MVDTSLPYYGDYNIGYRIGANHAANLEEPEIDFGYQARFGRGEQGYYNGYTNVKRAIQAAFNRGKLAERMAR